MVLCSSAFAQDNKPSALKPNKHMVFARKPAESNNPGNASQTFKGDDFIYGRVFFNQSLKEALFLDANEEGRIPIDVFVEDLTNNHSLYISFDLKNEELERNYFDFDILPDPAKTLRNSKSFETGRFSFFINAESLESLMPVFKFTVGDATGYIMVDFRGSNLQQIKARDHEAFKNAHVTVEGEEED
jgi:hypothetical protein